MWKLLLATIMLAGCGGGPDFGSPTLTRTGGCGGGQEGVVVLAWTVRGAAPSSASCQGIDHLQVALDGGGCSVGIAPVPCTITHWRYDHLPEGQQTVSVSALSASGATVVSGTALVQLTPSVPSSATAIDLR